MIEVCKIPSCVEIVCGRDSALHYVFQYKDLQTSNETHRDRLETIQRRWLFALHVTQTPLHRVLWVVQVHVGSGQD